MRGHNVGHGPVHTPACRARIEAEVEKDQILKKRLEAARDRRDRYMEREMESTPWPSTQDSRPGEARPEDDGIPEVTEEDGE